MNLPRTLSSLRLLAALLGLAFSAMPRASLAASTPTPDRVGNWELGSRAALAVAADPRGGALQFVFSDRGRMHHSQSVDAARD